MKKASRTKRSFDSPYGRAGENGMDATDPEDLPLHVKGTKLGGRVGRKFVSPDDPSPHDGLTGRESEDALLEAILPTLPKQGLSAPSAKMTRGALVRQHKLEARELRDTIRTLKESRARLNGDSRHKPQQKSITQEIKSMEDELEQKHARELEEFDAKNKATGKHAPTAATGKINFKSINLDFTHIKFDAPK